MRVIVGISVFLTVFFCKCSNGNEDSSNQLEDFKQQANYIIDQVTCPEGHQDSIIPIVYGYPNKELFAQADSGIVALGGCELSDENWWCTIHEIEFE